MLSVTHICFGDYQYVFTQSMGVVGTTFAHQSCTKRLFYPLRSKIYLPIGLGCNGMLSSALWGYCDALIYLPSYQLSDSESRVAFPAVLCGIRWAYVWAVASRPRRHFLCLSLLPREGWEVGLLPREGWEGCFDVCCAPPVCLVSMLYRLWGSHHSAGFGRHAEGAVVAHAFRCVRLCMYACAAHN